ncbi:MAG: MerR family transcriptional regulator [Clostridiales bacterium]
MKTVKEVSVLTGITVRTLHYYDEIGLFCPTAITEKGYRLYDDLALSQLQEILFFREMGFPLKEIKTIRENPQYNKKIALKNHIEILKMKKNRLENLIDLAQATLKGENTMEFEAFDDKEIKVTQEKYKEEAKERWGETTEYQNSEDKTKNYSQKQWELIRQEMDEIMNGFGAEVGNDPKSPHIQKLVKDWQEHLTKYYYDATNELLGALGEMYVADPRFTANIDKYGKGVAKLLSDAIAIYVK